jgi:cob(I)alamin adenosyltransferase
MPSGEKYNLAEMLTEIEDDIHEQAKDLSQQKDIPQEIITSLMLENLKTKKKNLTAGSP